MRIAHAAWRRDADVALTLAAGTLTLGRSARAGKTDTADDVFVTGRTRRADSSCRRVKGAAAQRSANQAPISAANATNIVPIVIPTPNDNATAVAISWAISWLIFRLSATSTRSTTFLLALSPGARDAACVLAGHVSRHELDALVNAVIDIARLTKTPVPTLETVAACIGMLNRRIVEDRISLAPRPLEA